MYAVSAYNQFQLKPFIEPETEFRMKKVPDKWENK